MIWQILRHSKRNPGIGNMADIRAFLYLGKFKADISYNLCDSNKEPQKLQEFPGLLAAKHS